jgi:hypothetical protein
MQLSSAWTLQASQMWVAWPYRNRPIDRWPLVRSSIPVFERMRFGNQRKI